MDSRLMILVHYKNKKNNNNNKENLNKNKRMGIMIMDLKMSYSVFIKKLFINNQRRNRQFNQIKN